MNKYKFRAYYEFNGPSYSDPFRTQKSLHEVYEALRQFPDGLSYFFPSSSTTIQADDPQPDPKSCFVSITTSLPEKEVLKLVSHCLNTFDLFGEIIQKPDQ